jgi:hypothetical protein
MLAAIRLVHTLIYVVMAVAVFTIIYCGIVDRIDWLLYLSLGLVVGECVVFIGNGMVCPLTNMAKAHGAEKGYVFDAFLPERWTRYTPFVFGFLFFVGLVLVAWRLID